MAIFSASVLAMEKIGLTLHALKIGSLKMAG